MKKSIVNFLLVTLIIGCDADFLDKKPLETATVESLFTDVDGLKLAVNGIYDVLQGDMWGGSFYYLTPTYDANSEDATLAFPWEGNIALIAEGNIIPTSGGVVDYKWDFGYKGIARANAVLENIDNPEIDLEEAVRTKYKAEVRFLRALMYFELATYYGGVPLVLQPLGINEAKLPRNSKDEVITAVLEDLDYAASNLDTSPLDNELGRPTKQSALGLKTRVLIYQKRYPDAAAAALETMALEASGATGLSTDYESLFNGTNEGDKEILFSIGFKGATASSADVGEGNVLSTAHGPLSVESGGGWGSISYQEPMFDAFYLTDGLPKDQSPLYDPANEYANRDPRLTWSFLVPGLSTWLGKPYTEANYSGYITALPLNPKKWVNENDTNSGLAGEVNYIILRYADVLLMYAEAQNEVSGPDASVYEAINKIRARAQMPDVTPGLSKDDMRKTIQHERKVEFNQEGLRYFDLIRWGLAFEKINSNTRRQSNWKEYHALFPIPQKEINANPFLEQNPGYAE
jgi:hypothetical protein